MEQLETKSSPENTLIAVQVLLTAGQVIYTLGILGLDNIINQKEKRKGLTLNKKTVKYIFIFNLTVNS